MRLDKIIHTRFYLVGAKIRQGEVSFAIHCCDDVRIGRRRSTGKLQQDCASGTSRAGSKRLINLFHYLIPRTIIILCLLNPFE